MPLTNPVLPSEVESVGRLTPELFNFSTQGELDAFVQSAIEYADSWMAGNMGEFYNLTTPFWAPIRQHRGQIYLALEAIYDSLKAEKILGTHFPYMSEDSASYERLIDNEWGQRAREALDLWLTIETVGGATGFAKPVFLITEPVPLVESSDNDLESINTQLEEQLARARGFSNADVGTIAR